MNRMKKEVVIISIIAFIVLIIGWWLVSPFFINKLVDEKLPGTNLDISNDTQENIKLEDSDLETKFQGSFVDADSFHKTSGVTRVIKIDGKRYLSLENFKTTNGPDLYVYLATNKYSKKFVNLGRLKGNVGDQNYEIPDDVDINSHNNVLIWCKAFSVLFGSAELK